MLSYDMKVSVHCSVGRRRGRTGRRGRSSRHGDRVPAPPTPPGRTRETARSRCCRISTVMEVCWLGMILGLCQHWSDNQGSLKFDFSRIKFHEFPWHISKFSDISLTNKKDSFFTDCSLFVETLVIPQGNDSHLIYLRYIDKPTYW